MELPELNEDPIEIIKKVTEMRLEFDRFLALWADKYNFPEDGVKALTYLMCAYDIFQ